MSAVAPRGEPAAQIVVSRPLAVDIEASAALGAEPADATTLGQLLRQAGRAVRAGLPAAVWVVAAVAAVKPARGGASVELVEAEVSRAEAGQLRAYLPDGVLQILRRTNGHAIQATDLVGMDVVLQVSVDLSPRWGVTGRILALAPGIEHSLARRLLDAAVARLRTEGLLDRQRRLPVPRDVTRLTVVHPPAAAGWGDVAGELARWAAAGLVEVRSVPVLFEGPGAAAGIADAVRRATEVTGGSRPDLVLLVRGGGAAASLGALDDEALARSIATAPVPVVTGAGHAVDATLADRVAWRSADTPSKAVARVREVIVSPARRARADHAAVLAAVSAAVERAGPRLAILERRATAEALRQVVATSQRLDRGWSAVREAAEGTRGRLVRLDDGLDRLAASIEAGSPLLVGRTASELAALMEVIRTRARRACAGADHGTRELATVSVRAAALVDTAGADIATLRRAVSTAARTRLDRAAADTDDLARTIREHGRGHATRADDGGRALAAVAAAVAETHRTRDATITRLRESIEAAVARRLDAAAAALDRALATLDAADPARVLARGYTLVTDVDGRVLTSAAAAKTALSLVLRFADGTIAVRPIQPQPTTGD